MATSALSEALIAHLNSKLAKHIVEAGIDLGDVVVRIRRDSMTEFFNALKNDPELQFDLFLNVTAVDWLDAREERFELVYHLMSLPFLYRLRVKLYVPEGKPEADSMVNLWPGANFMEREVWDMFGITFKGHPDLRRILMYEEFKGHPLRKDYPVQAKQPRIAMRHPEVRNTAVDMVRAPLVKINRRTQSDGAVDKAGRTRLG